MIIVNQDGNMAVGMDAVRVCVVGCSITATFPTYYTAILGEYETEAMTEQVFWELLEEARKGNCLFEMPGKEERGNGFANAWED